MSVIFILIACSMLLATAFLVAYLWASRSGQFEDEYTPSVRVLFEDEIPESGQATNHQKKNPSESPDTKKSKKNSKV